MSDQLFDIYFSGQLLPGNELAEVRAKIGKLFKASDKMLDQLFSGKPVKIKKAVDMDKAVKYRVSFRDIGALVEIRPAQEAATAAAGIPDVAPAKPAATPTAASATASKPAASDTDAELAMPGAIMDDTPRPPPAQIDTGSLSMGEANQGSLEEFATPVEPAPLPDISALDISSSTAPLDETPAPEPLEIDISELDIDNSERPLDNTPAAEEPAIDISELSAEPANSGSLEEFSIRPDPVPLPDISKLSLK
ncbi:MAG: hypothetical protein PVG66_15435 [Chromatiales bacterium]|jgi:hypothetical protein